MGSWPSSVASRCRNRDVPWAPTSRAQLGSASASRSRNQIPVLMMDLRKRTTPGRLGIFRGYYYRTDSHLFQVYWRASMVRFTPTYRSPKPRYLVVGPPYWMECGDCTALNFRFADHPLGTTFDLLRWFSGLPQPAALLTIDKR